MPNRREREQRTLMAMGMLGNQEARPNIPVPVECAVTKWIAKKNQVQYDWFLKILADDFKKKSSKSGVVINIAGLTKVGKSSLIEGLSIDLPVRFKDVQFYTHDISDSVDLTREIFSLGELGSFSPDKYPAIAVIDNYIVRSFLELEGRKCLLREVNFMTQNFNRRREVFGIPRGDLEFTKELIEKGVPTQTIVVNAAEAGLRRKNIEFWDMMKNVPLDQIAVKEKEAGIANDTDDPQVIKERYEKTNAGVSRQHLEGLTEIIHTLCEEGEVYDDALFKNRDFVHSLNEIRKKVYKNPRLVNILVMLAYFQLAKNLYGEIHSPRAKFFNNMPMPEGTKRSGARKHEKLSLIKELKRRGLLTKEKLQEEIRKAGFSIL